MILRRQRLDIDEYRTVATKRDLCSTHPAFGAWFLGRQAAKEAQNQIDAEQRR